MTGDFSGVANKYLGAFCYFREVQTYGDKEVAGCTEKLWAGFLLKQKQKQKHVFRDWSRGKEKQFPRVKFPKISFKRVYAHTDARMPVRALKKKSEAS